MGFLATHINDGLMKTIATICLLIFSFPVFAKTIHVGKSQVVSSLRHAIKIANPGDTILLQKGIYKEGNLIIDKPLKLIGVDEPVLDGESKYEILTVTGSNVLVKGIRFRNSGHSGMNDYASISVVDAQFIIVENNFIENSFFGIHLANSISCIIRNNEVVGNPTSEQNTGNAIHLWKCDNIIVDGNNVQGHRDGIYFEFVTNSFVRNNTSIHNIRYGLHFMFSNFNAYIKNIFRENGAGVAVMYSHHVQMYLNHFDHNWGSSAYGLLLKDISDAVIINNKFDKNTVAILMESSNRIEIQNCRFSNNGWALRIQANCDQSVVHHNIFTANTFDVSTNGTMILSKFYNNYWDKYEGYDIDKDGRGDVPYHPVSMFSMVVENNPNALILLRSFMVTLLDKAEKAIPSLTPIDLVDEQPLMRRNQL